jgi:arylsulfatase A
MFQDPSKCRGILVFFQVTSPRVESSAETIMKHFFRLAVAVLVALTQESIAKPVSKPNIILILADDLGIGNISCYGADNFKTPRIDALAKDGIRFQHGYAQPLCGPSRAELLTGRYAFHTGMTGNDSGPRVTPQSEMMIPRVLKPAGYVSAEIGKWGQLKLQPADFGFDEYLRFEGSGVYWRDDSANGNATYTIDGKTKAIPKDKYLPDMMHEYLVDFIKRHRDQPFFAYYSLSHVHRNVPHLSMRPTPDSKPDSQTLFADNISYMDKLVGQLVDELEALKLREKTLIIFVGDNGTAGGEHEKSTIGGRNISGHKGDMLEGGSLVPTIANWPGTIAKGKVSQDLIDFSDYLPTFAELAGAPLPAGVVMDGHSFAPQLLGKKGNPREWIFVELGRHWYVREANWKLNEKNELFDMSGAPFEEKLVAGDQIKGKAASAQKRLQSVLQQLDPAGGKTETGESNGKHDRKGKKKVKVK